MNGYFLLEGKPEYKEIYECGQAIEKMTESAEIAKTSRRLLDILIHFVYQKCGKDYPLTATMLEVIDTPWFVHFVDNDILLKSLHYVRKLGINAEHGKHIKKTEAKVAGENICFFTTFVYRKFEEPETVPDIVLPKIMSEADTRRIYIDLYLREAGWEVVPPSLKTTLPDGTEISCGTVIPGKACCEIKVEGMNNVSGVGFCDYVLYGADGNPLAIVEAKATGREALTGAKQVQDYGECMRAQYGYVPVLYYTNGYDIYVMDGLYPSRKVMAFHTAEELTYLIQRRNRNDITDLTINDEITGRPYQKMAITKVCERFNDKFRRSLLVMATGTGKTRVAISLVDVLLRNNWIKNVLFLADRTSLVKQAFSSFRDHLPNMSYCVLNDRKTANEPNARITFSTYQTMIGYIDAEEKEYSCGRFDLIIVDEAHRSIFNRYGSIFEYFDALLVGLTATPRDQVDANTYQLFGCESGEPNFVYSLEEAVRDKYLVYYKEENRTTKLLERGIKYSELSAEDKEKVDSVLDEEEPDDETVIPKNQIFRLFYNMDTCAKVLDDLMEHGLRVEWGEKLGKTIIFAYNHVHADLIVKTFRANYPSLGEKYCQLIDNQVKGAEDLITQFHDDPQFRIAVSVDMLDTGIDVPSVLNLIFFKPVKSEIKFIQMIGRGTRLCKELIDGKDKEFFLIFDYCANFEYFDAKVGGVTHENGKSLSQRLFDIRMDILVELQRYERQCDERCKAYYDKLKPLLFGKVQDVRKNASCIAVRRELRFVDKYIDYDAWESIAPLDKKEIQLHITRLINGDVKEDVHSLQFDLQMLEIELSVLARGSAAQVIKQVENVRNIAKYLLDNAGATSDVKAKAEALTQLVSVAFWNDPTIDRLEKYREDVRALMSYLPPKAAPVLINIGDEILMKEPVTSGMLDIRTYREKVIDYLAENLDNTTIQKIKNLEPIDANDLRELERILWHELGTKEDYQSVTDIDNLAAFIRSIVGIDQTVINEKFGEFLNDNVLNSTQQEFVKAIIDYARENGDIVAEDLIDKAPFDSYDISALFGNNIVIVTQMVNKIHQSIVAA